MNNMKCIFTTLPRAIVILYLWEEEILETEKQMINNTVR